MTSEKNYDASNNGLLGKVVIALLIVLALQSLYIFFKNESSPGNGETSQRVVSSSQGDKQKICEYYIASVMYKSPSIMSSRLITKDSAYFFEVSYRRNSDNTVWEYVCHIDEKNIVWAALDNGSPGRWRYEEDATYSVKMTSSGKRAHLSIPNIGSINFAL